MWGRAARGAKARWYPAIVGSFAAVSFLGLSLLLLKYFASEPAVTSSTLAPLSTPETTVSALPEGIPSVAPSPVTVPASPLPIEDAPPASTTVADAKVVPTRQGALRISNPTDYPIRVALLAQKPGKRATSNSTGGKSDYDIPAHWDFAPQEGGNKGLIVSLPDRTIVVRPGDVLTAFAQDGSRRYWGPYVVGDTPEPVWNPKTAEWQLTLQP